MLEERCQEMERLADGEKSFLWTQALRITGKTEDAEDLLQETLLKVYKGFNGFSIDTNFRAWARKIMVNTHINSSRKQAFHTAALEDDRLALYSVFTDGPAHVSGTDDPERVFFHNHLGEEGVRLLLSLPEIYRTAFLMFHFCDFTYAEISKVVKAPVGTVKSRIHRARMMMAGKARRAPGAGAAMQ